MTKPTKPKTPPAPVTPPPTFNDGVIVGLLMARGSFTGDKHMPRIMLRGTDLELLEWLRQTIGGTISGPYEQAGRADFHQYQISGAPLAKVVNTLYAHMPQVPQRGRFLNWLMKHDIHPDKIVS